MNLQQRLDNEFSCKTLELTDDKQGKNIATMISSHKNTQRTSAVLYIHGFIDYFFHPHVADEFIAKDFDFYALDLRKYGRSMLEHQTANFCTSLEEYFEEITLAIEHMQAQGVQDVYIFAHSTGCTTASLYANKGAKKDCIKAIILNSPFLDMPTPKLVTHILYGLGEVIMPFAPMAKVPAKVNPVYPHTLHSQFNGDWDYDLSLKPVEGFGIYFKWSKAIITAQRYLREHSNISAPILVLHSHQSSTKTKVCDETMTSDTVLNVEHIKRDSALLGSKVTIQAIQDALHDVFLSSEKVRTQAFHAMFMWLQNVK